MSQTLHFSVCGEFISDRIRDFIYEGNISLAWKAFKTITDDKNIFKSLAKGQKKFKGINDLTLVGAKNKDVAYEAFARLVNELSRYKQDREQLEFNFENNKLDMGLSLQELVSVKNKIDLDILNCEQAIAEYRNLMDYSDEDVKLALLFRYTSNNLKSNCAWITEKGWFIPVKFANHDQFIYDYNDKVTDNLTVANLEKRWIRITEASGTRSITIFGFKPTAKQELTFLKWAETNKVLTQEGDYLLIHHFGGMLVYENGQYKLIKHKE